MTHLEAKPDIPGHRDNQIHASGMSDLDSKKVRLAPNWKNPRLLKNNSVSFGLPSQNVLKSDLKKSRIFQFDANLTHFVVQSEIRPCPENYSDCLVI